jgi:hypothetical protein
MTNTRILLTSIALLSFVATGFAADSTPPASTNAQPKDVSAPARKSQSDVASKTASFGMISKTNETFKTALDAHALAEGLKEADKVGAFKGTVTKIFEPRGGNLAIMNFDADYKTAMTGLLKGENFTNFPDLKLLVGKEAVVSGKLIDFQGRPEIVLTNSDQIKVVGQ